ncbi:MAG TPA: PilZ domain-containing protein [Candidatus Omnitrophota bacterium]|nr:PilZ domain-containing protein [Candidatus Omnitrophota bacterium]HNQ50450.1 PilZ domain-containing protein [Candidatus Omnitrophota bacterium]HQO37406.1 PilZ domain-containing protein [Candidatus Omnitrophota bacterium]HQQ05717.1 PilZ domain-containing protein [Candidatus Omnitrophota bacterium]
MHQWTHTEKRRAPRFEISIPILNYTGPAGAPVPATLRDMSAYGIGAMMDCALPIGTALDIVLMMPEQEDRVRLQGSVIWVQDANSLGYYRAGIRFQQGHFNPIPYILKMLQAKAKSRFSSSRLYPA